MIIDGAAARCPPPPERGCRAYGRKQAETPHPGTQSGVDDREADRWKLGVGFVHNCPKLEATEVPS